MPFSYSYLNTNLDIKVFINICMAFQMNIDRTNKLNCIKVDKKIKAVPKKSDEVSGQNLFRCYFHFLTIM